jgi:hypothetical protein
MERMKEEEAEKEDEKAEKVKEKGEDSPSKRRIIKVETIEVI